MTSDFTGAAMLLETMQVNLQPEDYELAKQYLLKRDAQDIIDMLAL